MKVLIALRKGYACLGIKLNLFKNNYKSKKNKFDFISLMEKQQKKIEDIYYDKYFEKNNISSKTKEQLEKIEKKLDSLDDHLNLFKEIDILSGRLVADLNKLKKEDWNDLSLEIILKKDGTPFLLNINIH